MVRRHTLFKDSSFKDSFGYLCANLLPVLSLPISQSTETQSHELLKRSMMDGPKVEESAHQKIYYMTVTRLNTVKKRISVCAMAYEACEDIYMSIVSVWKSALLGCIVQKFAYL